MSVTGYKRVTFSLVVVIVVLLFLVLDFNLRFHVESLSERDTWSAIRDFDRMRDRAVGADPIETVQILIMLTEIPAKQDTNALVRIIENERLTAIREIIVYLRMKTGEDLGNDPKKWIQKYEK